MAIGRIDLAGKYQRIWMRPNGHPKDVKLLYEFGALASVYIISPSFLEISLLPKWIKKVVH